MFTPTNRVNRLTWAGPLPFGKHRKARTQENLQKSLIKIRVNRKTEEGSADQRRKTQLAEKLDGKENQLLTATNLYSANFCVLDERTISILW